MGVATVSRIDKIIGLFCRILSLLLGSFAKETYNFIDPTNQSHPIHNTSWRRCVGCEKTHGIYQTYCAVEYILLSLTLHTPPGEGV